MKDFSMKIVLKNSRTKEEGKKNKSDYRLRLKENIKKSIF